MDELGRNLIIRMTREGSGAAEIRKELLDMKYTAADVAAEMKKLGLDSESAAKKARDAFMAATMMSKQDLRAMKDAVDQMREERRLLDQAALAFGRQSGTVSNAQVGLDQRIITPKEEAYSQLDRLAGPGMSEELVDLTGKSNAYKSVLSELINLWGVADTRVSEYAKAMNVTVPSLENYNQQQKLAAVYTSAVTDDMRMQLTVIRNLEHDYAAYKALGLENSQAGQQVLASLNAARPAQTLTPSAVSSQKFDTMFGPGSAQGVRDYNTELQANKQILRDVVTQHGAASAMAKQWAASIGVSTAELEKMGGAVVTTNGHMSQFVRGMAAGLFQFSLLAGGAVIAGRAITEFTTGAIDEFRKLQSAAQEVSQVQFGIDTKDAEESLMRLQQQVPAALNDIKTAYYEVSSVGGQSAQVSEELTRSITVGAAAARAETKGWTDNVIGSMNTFGLWGKTADETYRNATRVQAEFYQAAKDSVGTPEQLSRAWGPVALAIQQAGGSMEDGLALMVAASRGAGDFQQNMTTVYRFVNSLNTDKVRKDLSDFGISVEDGVTGKTRPAIDILEQLKAKLQEFPEGAQTSIIERIFPELRATRGAANLLNNLSLARSELDKLHGSGDTWNAAINSYMDTEAAKVQLLENQFQTFREQLGKKIDPVRIVYEFIQGDKPASSTASNALEYTWDRLLEDITGSTGVQSQRSKNLDKMNKIRQDIFGGNVLDKTQQETDKMMSVAQKLATLTDEQLSKLDKKAIAATGLDELSKLDINQIVVKFKALTGAGGEAAGSIDDIQHSILEVQAVVPNAMGALETSQTNLAKWTRDWNSFGNAVKGAAATFGVALQQQMSQGQVKEEFGKLPSELQNAFGGGIGASTSLLDPNRQKIVDTLATYAGQVKVYTDQINNASLSDSQHQQAAEQIQLIEQQAAAYTKLHQAELDPVGYAAAQKDEEQRQKNIALLNDQYARMQAQTQAADALAAAQEHLADVTAHWNAQISIQRDLVSQLRSAQTDATSFWSDLAKTIKDATDQGGSLTNLRDTSGPSQIADWQKKQTDLIEQQRAAQVRLVNSQGLPAAEAGAQIASINAAAKTASDAIVASAGEMNKALSQIPDGLTQTKGEFENTISWYKGKISELQKALDAAEAELKRRQDIVQNQAATGTPQSSGLRGPLQPSAEDLASSKPAFLNDVPGNLSAVMGGAKATAADIAALRKLIEDPVQGTGFLVPFMQQLADAQAKLRDDQAAAVEVRAVFAEREYAIESAQLELTQRRTVEERKLADEQYELTTRQTLAMRALADEQYRLSQLQYAMRQQENAQMRPLNDALWTYNQALSEEQDRMTVLSRRYSQELNPLQREYNALQREAQALAHADELRNMSQALDNQANTLSKLTPGTAQYLAVRQGLAKSEADYAIKSRSYTLQDRIAEINAQKDAEVEAEQAKLDALGDLIREKTRERDVDQHNWDLRNREIQDEVDANNNAQQVASHNFELEQRQITDRQNAMQHGWELEQRIIDDRRLALSDEQRQFDHNETLKENADQRLIDLAGLELQAEQRKTGAWLAWQQQVNIGLAAEVKSWNDALNQESADYEVWKTTKLQPIQDAVNKILDSGGKTITDSFGNAITIISGPGGVIDELTILGNVAEGSAKQAEKGIQNMTKELQNYYTLLDMTLRYQALGTPPPFAPPPLPPWYVAPPGAPGSKENPYQTPTAPPPAPPVVQPIVNPPGTHNPPVVVPPPNPGHPPINPPHSREMPGMPVDMPAHNGNGYSGAGGTTNINVGAVHMQSKAPYRSQADADADARTLWRAVVGYADTTGTNSGWGAEGTNN